jgi:acyl CoA:acetate/3-ketoacid CoA transferase alpha subunit
MSLQEIVSQLSDGVGGIIGGWGPRRKPMASARSASVDLKDLTDAMAARMWACALPADGICLVSLDFIALEHLFPRST